MITLNPKQRRELRAQAHALHPVVSIGQHGLTPQVVHEIDLALHAHSLVKVRVFSEDRAEREALLSRIADELDAAPVQHIGKLLILWRPLEEAPAKTAVERRATKAGERRTPASTKQNPRASVGATKEKAEPRRGRSRSSDSAATDATDARRRRRRATNAPRGDASAASSSATARRRKPQTPQEIARGPRGKSAPNPRRRRRAP